MKLKDAYIIDGDVIEKRIAELEQLLNLHNELNPKDTNWKIIARIAELKDLKQHLKPALPIVEEIWDEGFTTGHIQVTNKLGSPYLIDQKNRILTKDF